MAEEVANARAIRDWANDKFATKNQIPSVGSGTLTLKQNGTTLDTFSANESANKEVDIVESAKADGTSLESIRFGIDGDGNYGYYKAGADTVTPFKLGGGGNPFTGTRACYPFPRRIPTNNYGFVAFGQLRISAEEAACIDKILINITGLTTAGSTQQKMMGVAGVILCHDAENNVYAVTRKDNANVYTALTDSSGGNKSYYSISANSSWLTAPFWFGDSGTTTNSGRFVWGYSSLAEQNFSEIYDDLIVDGYVLGAGNAVVEYTSQMSMLFSEAIFIFGYCGRIISGTSAYAYAVFSVNPNGSTIAPDGDTYSVIEANEPQVKIVYRS